MEFKPQNQKKGYVPGHNSLHVYGPTPKDESHRSTKVISGLPGDQSIQQTGRCQHHQEVLRRSQCDARWRRQRLSTSGTQDPVAAGA